MSGFGYAWHGTPPNPTIEDRVTALETNLLGVNKRLDDTNRDHLREFRTQKTALAAEVEARERENRTLAQKLEVVETGGLYVSTMGVAWLVAGLTLSTIPNELLVLWK